MVTKDKPAGSWTKTDIQRLLGGGEGVGQTMGQGGDRPGRGHFWPKDRAGQGCRRCSVRYLGAKTYCYQLHCLEINLV